MPPKIPASVDYEIDAATGWPADELRRAMRPKYWGWIDNIWRIDEDIRDIPAFAVDPITGWPR